MSASNKPQPERHDSIQSKWEKAQSAFTPLRAVMELVSSPDVPARSRVLLGISCVSTTGIVALGNGGRTTVALAAILACNLSLALLTKETSQPRCGTGVTATSPPKPRPRRGYKR